MRNISAIVFLTLFVLSGCSLWGGKDKKSEAENWSVDRIYREARDALDTGYYSRAVEYYEVLETRYPFGKYAQQALLDLAYAYYKDEEPEQAIAAADRFLRLYPQNEGVDYAYYIKGLSNFSRGQSISHRFLPTDEAQRDTGASQLSFNDFSELVRRFPNSNYAPDAVKRMQYLKNNLAKHEVYVAHYYMRRGAYVAAANRARYVIENYEKTPAVPDALIVMAKAYKVLEMNDLANDAMRVLKLNYPDHPGIGEVENTVVN